MNSLLAGYGEQIITPDLGKGMTGYGCYLDRNAEMVLDELKVRAVSLRRGGERLVLISCDLIGLTVEFSDAVRGEIAAGQEMDRSGGGPELHPYALGAGEPAPDRDAGAGGGVSGEAAGGDPGGGSSGGGRRGAGQILVLPGDD